MAIGGANDPYVHSNIANWSAGGYESLPTFVEKNNVNKSIDILESVRNQLMDEANDFLAGSTADFMNYCVDNEYKMYADITVQLLQDPDAISALMLGDTSLQMSRANVEKLLEKVVPDKLKNQIIDFLKLDEIETVGSRNLAVAIADGISNDEMILTVDGGTFIRDLYKGATGRTSNEGLDNKVLKEITGVAVNQLSSGKSSAKIIDAIEAIIEKTGLYQQDDKINEKATDSVNSFMIWFRDLFLARAKSVVKFYEANQSPEDYLEELEKKLREKIKKNFKDIYNTVGALGDEFYVSAYQADAQTAVLNMTMESVGTVHEKDMEKKYGKAFKGLKQMVTHHDPGKQSQTDILIKNQAGKTVRVQAKNASLRNAEFSNNGLINLNAHVQRDRDLISLLEALDVPDVDNIAYTVANSLWFSYHDSITGVRDEGKLKVTNGKADTGVLSNLEKELSIFFSTKAENFLGITMDEAATTEAKILAGASNIFFLKNGRLIPTYTLVDEVIADLIHYRDDGLSALQGLNFKINKPSNTSWKYPNDVNFWVEKAKQDFANRIAIGTAQGSGAISSIKVHGTFPRVHELSSLVIDVN